MDEKDKVDQKNTGKKISIKTKIMIISAGPVLVLGIILSLFCSYESYSKVYDEVNHELRSMCVSVYEFMLTAGARESSGMFDSSAEGRISTFFGGIKTETEIDVSYFVGDTRYITTINDDKGGSINGTKASAEVVKAVIEGNKEYFSDDVIIDGKSYFGYYMPVHGEDEGVIGMTFAGRNKDNVSRSLTKATANSLIMTLLSTLAALVVSLVSSAKMVKSLDTAIDFMRKVSTGDTDCEPGRILVGRSDEIGEMGRSAVELQKSLKTLISTDPLTGLLNRRSCNIKLSELYKNVSPYTVIMGDIDHFKDFNDKYGHACGDEVLKHISDTLVRCVGKEGFVSRWGGEEFLLVIEGDDYGRALEILSEFRAAIREDRIEYGGKKLTVTLTFGVQAFKVGMVPEEVVNLADEKLYYGKNHGRNCVIEEMAEGSSGNSDSGNFFAI